VTPEARRAIAVIRECIQTDRFVLTIHFSQRMQQRGLFWPDVQAVIDKPENVLSQEMDQYNRPKWIISGKTASTGKIEIICAIEIDETETEFITLYWQD
jgi:hypothetical protein